MRRLTILVMLVVAALWPLACGEPATAPPATEPKASAVPGKQTADWQPKWESMVSEAKKEGKLIVYMHWVPEVRTAIGSAVKNKYGVDVEFLPFERGADLTARILGERRAGMAVVDVISSGATSMINVLKPGGVIQPAESLLILPEVRNPQAWQGGKLPYIDKDQAVFNMVGPVQRSAIRNSDMVKENEVTTYKDILKPQFKGKITLVDPTTPGLGNMVLTHLAVDLWNQTEATEYFRQLMKQEVVITRDNRIQVESVARGKFAIGVGALADAVASFLEIGAPVAPVIMKEGVRISAGQYSLAAPVRPAHPAATTVFINWLLSKEGQTVLSSSSHLPSMRLDVPTQGINPVFLPAPGEKLYPDTEEWEVASANLIDVARKIIEESR